MTDDPDPGRESGFHPESTAGLLLVAFLLTALTSAGLLLLAVGCLVLAFFFALFENALQHHSRVRLMEAAKRKDRAEAIEEALDKTDDLVFASKMGRGLTQIVAIATIVIYLVEIEATTVLALSWAVAGAAVFLLFNVGAPYVLGERAGHVILLRGLLPYSRAVAVLRPLASLVKRVAAKLMRAGSAPDPTEEIADEILSVVEEGAREGTLDSSEKEMIEGVMEMRGVTVEHIMTPRTEMVCLAATATVPDAIERSQQRGLSRLPVYENTPDNVRGILYMKDLLPYLGRGETPTIIEILRPAFFVPESKIVGDLLHEMKARQVHLAVVLDEYGGTAGVVTIEDILEEIVGEIADEHEGAAVEDVVRVADNAATVEGRTHIDDLNKALDLEVPESEEYETVGGLLFNRMGRVPANGEQLDVDGVRFTILEADERRITRVKVTVLPRPA